MKKLLFILAFWCTIANANDKAELRVFVSSSMNEQLIKQYYEQASKNGGVLVMRGLIDGSFQELINFVVKIAGEEGGGGGIQIDDEAFEMFGVTQVPTIVLSKGDKYDKITGSISVAAALEKFVESGDVKRDEKN